MTEGKNGFLSKSLAGILLLIFIAVITMVSLTFFKPQNKINILSKTLDFSSAKIWEAIYIKNYYLSSKKEITKSIIYDSVKPQWTEFYTASDSVENKTYKYISKKQYSYAIINRKYEQINGIAIRLDSLSENKTKVTIAECSEYFNSWAGIYFQMLHPNTVIDYEFVKINNTIKYIDSISQK